MKTGFKNVLNALSYIFLFGIVSSCTNKKDNEPSFDKSKENVYILINGQVTVLFLGEKEEIEIPSKVKFDGIYYPVTKIGNNVCNETVRTLHIPSSITEIEEDAFKSNNLTSVYIDDLESWCNIDFKYYEGWSQSKGLYFYSYANPLRKNAKLYQDGELVNDLKIPISITSLKPFTFAGIDVNSIIFPPLMETIDYNTFEGCILPELVIPETVKVIKREAFNNSKLNKLYTGDGVTEIESSAFADCQLSEVYFGRNANKIGSLAFENIKSPLTINVSTIISMAWPYETNSFRNSNLLCVNAPDIDTIIKSGFLSNETIDASYYIAINGEKVSTLEVPSDNNGISVGYINGITNIIFSEGINSIKSVFNLKELKMIHFPSSLYEINYMVNCENIEHIYCDAIIPPIFDEFSNSVSNCNEDKCILHVPKESIFAYREAPGWNIFKNIKGE